MNNPTKEKDALISRKFSNDIVLNKEINSSEVAVYVAMTLLISNATQYVYCSPDIISMTLFDCKCTSSSYGSLLGCLKKLSKRTDIDLKSINKTIYVGGSLQFIELKNDFVVADVKDIKTIMKSVDRKISFSVLRFWLSLLTTIYSKTRYGCMSLKNLSSMFGLSVNTILKYTKILEDLKILYVYRSNKYTVDSQYRNFKKITNIYGRYQDKEEIENIGRNFEEQHAAEQTANAAFPSLRSESMKYSHWRKGTHYELSELKTIYSAMKTQNEIHEKSGRTDRVKDLSAIEAEIEAEELAHG